MCDNKIQIMQANTISVNLAGLYCSAFSCAQTGEAGMSWTEFAYEGAYDETIKKRTIRKKYN